MKFFLKLLVACLTLLVDADYARGATVTKVKKSSITIDEGKESGFVKGSKACVYSSSGKKLACGKVRKSGKGKAIVKFSKKGRKRLKRVKKGFEVQLASGTQTRKGGKTIYGMAVRGMSTLGVMTPVTYNKLVYNGAAVEPGAASLWKSQGAASTALVSGGLEFELASLGLGLGFRYTSYQSFQADSDYSGTELFAKVLIESSTIGLWADYNYSIVLSRSSQIRISGGLDFAMSTVNVTASTVPTTDEESSGEELATLDSSLNAIGLRLGSSYDMYFNPFGISAGLNLIIPVAGEASGSASIEDAVNGEKLEGGDLAADMTTALDHKGAMGVQLLLGAFMGF